MNVTFIKNAQHDIHSSDGGGNQQQLRFQRFLEHLGGPGKSAAYGGRHAERRHGSLYGGGGVRQAAAIRQVKRNSRRGRQALMIDRQRCIGGAPTGKVGQRDCLAVFVDHKHFVQ
ncbi:hypothetical protein D3C71_1751340 [compost metagenome]